MKKKNVLYIAMGAVAAAGLALMVTFIVLNNKTKGTETELDKIQGSWEIYSFDTNPLTWPKELPFVNNQIIEFNENHMSLYVDGNVSYTADVTLDVFYLRLTPTGDFKNSTILPDKLRYNHLTDYNINFIDDSKGVQWDLIKRAGDHSTKNAYSNENIDGDWKIKYFNHNEDQRKVSLDTTNGLMKIIDPDPNKNVQVSFVWTEGADNQISVVGLGVIHIYMPNSNVMFFVQQQNANIYEMVK